MHTFRIHSTQPFDLKRTVESHGWVQLEPWRWDGATLSRNERVGNWKGVVSVNQLAGSKELRVTTSSPAPSEIRARVIRWLSLDWDISEFQDLADNIDLSISSYVRKGGGRFLRGSDFFEDLVKTICTINTTWSQTRSMVNNLVEMSGGHFPTPGLLLETGEQSLRLRCKLGFRAQTIINATQQLMHENVLVPDGTRKESEISYEQLLSIKGIGPYAAAHCMMLLHDFSRLPVDSEVTQHLVSKGLNPYKAADHFSRWHPYSFLGYKLKRIVDRDNWIGD